MARFFLRRLLTGLPTLLALTTVTFFLMRIAPGGPFAGNRRLPPEIRANLLHAFHLDEPVWRQFLRYLWGLLHLDFGPSMSFRDNSVQALISQGFPYSLQLGLAAMAVATLLGLLLGMSAALKRDSAVDGGAGLVGIAALAVPIFVSAPLAQLVFGVHLRWLPVAGWDGWRAKVLPVLLLALPNAAYVARLMRASMIETLRANYVRTARAKGLGPARIVFVHALRGAILPLVSYLGPATAITVTGSVVIEQIFQIPGIGRYFVVGATNRDYTLVMGVTLLYGGLVIAANILTDLARRLLDPRSGHD